MDRISALMDGELDRHAADRALLEVEQDEAGRSAWMSYHVIGDAMRGETLAEFDISQRVAAALAHEPTVLAPVRAPRTMNRPLTYALSAAASISAVAVVGWMAFSGEVSNSTIEIARLAPPSAVQGAPEPQLVSAPSDAQMNEYLLAHQGVSPSSGLHGVAPYIRTISMDPAPGR